MSRPAIPLEVQARILAESRRRCAVCFGLDNDLERKKGQIAHLDKNPANNTPENLAFLCFDHHDELDSTTRQSKGLSRLEVIQYREQLLVELERRWSAGTLAATPPVSPISVVLNVSNIGGGGGSGGKYAGGGGGGGAPYGSGGGGGSGATIYGNVGNGGISKKLD